MRSFCVPFYLRPEPRGITGRFMSDSPDSPEIGHASGGPVSLKEGKVNWESRLDRTGVAPRVLTVRLLAL